MDTCQTICLDMGYLYTCVSKYAMSKQAKTEYQCELQIWLENGRLIPYTKEELGPPRGLIPLMAVVQKSKEKVHPVLDYQELNGHVDAYIAHADVCGKGKGPMSLCSIFEKPISKYVYTDCYGHFKQSFTRDKVTA